MANVAPALGVQDENLAGLTQSALLVSDEDLAREEQQPGQCSEGGDDEGDQHRRRMVLLHESGHAREHPRRAAGPG